MTTRWRPDFDPDHLYFVTTTAAEHTRIFRRDAVKRILVDSLHYTSLTNQVALYAFVIMPNHVHVLLQCPQACPLKDWARAFKAGASLTLEGAMLLHSLLVAPVPGAFDAGGRDALAFLARSPRPGGV